MSKESLNSLLGYIQVTLTPDDMEWLGAQLLYCAKSDILKPYTMEEVYAMLEQSERNFAEGSYSSNEEVLARLYKKYGMNDTDAEEVELVESNFV